jgi:hypothetical protein
MGRQQRFGGAILAVGSLAALVASARAGEGPKPADAAQKAFERKELAAVEQELLEVRSELRRRKVELSLLKDKEQATRKEKLTREQAEKAVAEDRWMQTYQQRLAELHKIIEGVRAEAVRGEREPTLIALRKDLAEVKRQIAARRALLLATLPRQWNEEAAARVRKEAPPLQERIALLTRLEAVLAEEARRLGARVGPAREGDRVDRLEQEVRQLKAAVQELTAALKKK